MNEITLINNWVIEQFDNNDLVNTISIVPTSTLDNNKENIYPLVNADLLTSSVEQQYIIVSFRITVLQQRDIRPKLADTKLLSDCNYLDNLNETHSIAQRFINVLLMQNNNLNIEFESKTDLTILKDWRGNGLDGVQFDISLSIPNNGVSC